MVSVVSKMPDIQTFFNLKDTEQMVTFSKILHHYELSPYNFFPMSQASGDSIKQLVKNIEAGIHAIEELFPSYC